ncbi:MAG TPA: hypothetical protein VF691_07830 [Cytophagaceae bacterium]|jgi:hypothetical protein
MKNQYNWSRVYRSIFNATLLLIALFSCRPKFYEIPPAPAASAGTADFTKYVAVGSTITAGFMDDALYNEGQANSYPNLLAQKFKETKGDVIFGQANINSEFGWSGKNNLGKRVLFQDTCRSVSFQSVAKPSSETTVKPFEGDRSSITNLSVPFITLANINKPSVGTTTAFNNPKLYFENIVEPGSLGIASEARKRNGTFFTVWLGYVDALRYATSGGTTALPTTQEFTNSYKALLDSILVSGKASGVIANIPYVDQFAVITNNNRRLTSTSDPAKNPVRLTPEQANEFNTALGVTFFKGTTGNSNNFAISTGSGTIRPLNTSKDFVTRGAVLDSVGFGAIDAQRVRTCKGDQGQRLYIGFKTPIANKDVLDEEEVKNLRNQINSYNQALQQIVEEYKSKGLRLGVVDLNGFYNRLTDPLLGIPYGNVIIRANHPNLGPDFGGFYSLDRITPTPKGQALIANEFLKVINQVFGASFSLYSPDNFRGNTLPY